MKNQLDRLTDLGKIPQYHTKVNLGRDFLKEKVGLRGRR